MPVVIRANGPKGNSASHGYGRDSPHAQVAGALLRATPRLLFRGGQQPADAIGVRDDMMVGRDSGEPGVCRHQRLGSCRVSRGGQDRVERAEARSFREQAQSFAEVSFLDVEQRREQLYVVTGKFRCVFAVTTASTDVGELPDDLDSGSRQDRSACYCAD